MILGDIQPREGATQRPWRWIVAAVVLLVVAGVGFARCMAPDPTVPPALLPAASPTPSALAIATSSAKATASQAVKVTIRRPASVPHAPQIKSKNRNSEPETQAGSGRIHAQDEEIVIEVSQAIATVASSEASASVDHFRDATKLIPDYGRLGVIALTAPGILAADFQLARVDVPPWFAGVPLEVGLDAAINAQMAGAGVSVGGKGFATAGGWLGFHGGAGWYLGAGLRF